MTRPYLAIKWHLPKMIWHYIYSRNIYCGVTFWLGHLSDQTGICIGHSNVLVQYYSIMGFVYKIYFYILEMRCTVWVEILVGLIFGVLSNNYIWQYINLVKFKLMLYNLKCGLHDWWDFNLASSEKPPNFNPSQNFYSYGNVFLFPTKCLYSCLTNPFQPANI